MAKYQLTGGALVKICQGDQNIEPIFQVINCLTNNPVFTSAIQFENH